MPPKAYAKRQLIVALDIKKLLQVTAAGLVLIKNDFPALRRGEGEVMTHILNF